MEAIVYMDDLARTGDHRDPAVARRRRPQARTRLIEAIAEYDDKRWRTTSREADRGARLIADIRKATLDISMTPVAVLLAFRTGRAACSTR